MANVDVLLEPRGSERNGACRSSVRSEGNLSVVSESNLRSISEGAYASLLAEVGLVMDKQHARLTREVTKVVNRYADQLKFDAARSFCPTASASATIEPSEALAARASTIGTGTGTMENIQNAFRDSTQKSFCSSWREREDVFARSKRRTSFQSFYSSQQEKKATARASRGGLFLTKRPSRIPTPRVVPQTWANKLVSATWFECASCLLIIVNGIFFGLEAAYYERTELNPVFEAGSYVFTFVFGVELLLRIAADCWGFCFSQQWLWNLIDSVIMLVSLAELGLSIADIQGGANLTYIRVIRIARTVRIFRVMRVLTFFTSLRILIHSVLSTLKSLVWTMVLLGILLYVFGLLFSQAARDFTALQDSPEIAELDKYYGSLGRAIYTLFQAITNGVSWGQVALPLGLVNPIWEGVFTVFIMFIYFAVLNVVTGVFCQSAIESAQHDKDMLVQAQQSMKQIFSEQLERLFMQIDEQNTGIITLSMFEESLKDEMMKAYLDGLDLTIDDAWNLFKLLDRNESNGVDIEEFVTGCLRLRGRARSIDIHMLLYESTWSTKRLGDVLETLKTVAASCQNLVDFAVMPLPEDANAAAEGDGPAGEASMESSGVKATL